jgi:hypothetical protein
MWHAGGIDWLVLGSGYLLALGLFYWLGGVGRAGEAFRRWAGSASRANGPQRRSLR